MKTLILSATALLSSIFVSAQVIDIDVARGLPLETEVTVTGVVTNGSELGIIRYFQDGTGALSAYGPEVNGVALGDSITVSGVLKDYNGLLELDPILQLENHGQAVVPVDPITILPNQINETNEAVLVRVEGCIFVDGGNTFSGNTTYNFTNNGITNTMYVRTNHPLVGELIPVGVVDITAIVSQFTFTGFGGYQLLARGPEDISSPNPINIISAIDVSQLTSNGFTLTWNTDIPASTETFYTADINGEGMSDNVQTQNEAVTSHSLTLTGLNPGEVYFVQVFSVAGEDTARSNIFAAATVSNSTGAMHAYFNGGVDNTQAEPAENLAISTNVRDTIVAYIDRAQTSLDIAVYNINNPGIADAINDALDRNVTIRYIAEGQNANIALGSLNENIPVLIRENAMGSGMHNKFVVVDFESEEQSFVLTGSTNFTNNNLFTDLNNLIIIQDKALAKAYTIEFNEMWGSSGPTPNEGMSRFGEDKVNNTPEQFIVGGKKVELYFSPSDGTTNGIKKALETADASIDFALLLITQDDLANTLIEKNDNFFIEVRGMVNDPNISGSDFDQLNNAGVFVLEHIPTESLHHKYAVVDHADLNSDPLVITGSHNWSASANTVNDENTLVIHDAAIANQYYQEFIYQLNSLIVGTEDANQIRELKLYPNPTEDQFTLNFYSESAQPSRLTIYDIAGKVAFEHAFGTYFGQNSMTVQVGNLARGMYVVSLSGSWGQANERLVVVK
jgi:phosphatidylserine/phosphatidylglycerophosphate/cardiolipin synthase-like enzyme